MTRSIIVTDLTRFSKEKAEVCTAGIDQETGECIRPMPYLTSEACQRLSILPGGILRGDFEFLPNRTRPHMEDCRHQNLKFPGPCSSEEFKKVLVDSCSANLEDGFEISLAEGEKVIPKDHPAQCSIITLRVHPRDLAIVEDAFNPGRIKLNFRDQSGRYYRYLPITDLGFYDYAQKHRNEGELDTLNEEISAQEEAFLRIGLSRRWASPQGKDGFWLQGNGIYTFPRAVEGVRGYGP